MSTADLPEPDGWIGMGDGQSVVVPPGKRHLFNAYAVFTAEQMRAYGDKRAREAVPVGWIDVNDRLPPKNTEVLIAFRDSTLPATGQYTGHRCDHDGWSYPGENDPEEVGPVTHWMPLPEHPAPPAASPSPDMLEKK